MANQLKMTDKFEMAIYLKENWSDGLKLSEKSQSELSGHLSKKFNRNVTILNVRGLLKMAGLKQAASLLHGQRGGAHFPKESFTAIVKTLILMTEALRDHETILLKSWEEIDGLQEEPLIFTESADNELDKHLLVLRSYLAGVGQANYSIAADFDACPEDESPLGETDQVSEDVTDPGDPPLGWNPQNDGGKPGLTADQFQGNDGIPPGSN